MPSTSPHRFRLPSLSIGFAAGLLLAVPARVEAGKFDDVIEAFEGNGPYVEPLATLFGSISNSGWYQSASVGRGFGFYLGLPISLVAISDDDRSYSATFVDDGCQLYHQSNPGGTECRDEVPYTAPTIFGRERSKPNQRTVYDPNEDRIVATMPIAVSDGLRDLADFNWFPYLTPQLGVNLFHTELKLRYLGLPLKKYSGSLIGIGIQHDLASVLPELPVAFSLAGNLTWLGAEFTPGGNIDGTLELNGFSHFLGLLVGYNYRGWMEVFLETGWEGASLESGGTLTITDEDDPSNSEVVRPRLTVDGRNGFRAAFNLAFHFGYQGVVGQNMGANFGQHLGLLGFRLK